MEKKNILICLEGLDIGGVETAVLNQATTFLELGHNVVILARSGIYAEILESKGAIYKEFEFTLEDNFSKVKTQKIIEIIKEYQIEEVHIHQFPCILSAFTACLITNTPYIAYAHNGIAGVYEWFMTTFPVYETAIPYYYQYAHKIIAITEPVKQDIIKRFLISEDKILVFHNSISFEEADKIRTRKENKLNKFLLVSRFSKEKGNSVYNGIDLFSAYLEENSNATLTIIGDGELRKEVEEYVRTKQIEEKVTFLGSSNKVLEEMNEAEIILGLGRCILEAVAMQKIAIIMGYEEPKQLILPQNIENASNNNFSGRNMESETVENLVEQLKQLTQDQIENITKSNYDYAKEKLNIKNNIYTIEGNIEQTISAQEIFIMLVQIQEKENEEIKKNRSLKEKLEKEIEKEKNEIKLKDEEIARKQEKIEALEKELSGVYNSKRWKYIDKILNFLK